MNTDWSWDVRKAETNLRKHGIAFTEAVTVFADPLAKIFDDPDHSTVEKREIIVGVSNRRRLLIVVFTERDGGSIRIISARRAPPTSEPAMKKTPSPKAVTMRKEYVFDYAEARPNRFAAKQSATVSAVVLAPDVARVFESSAAVNKALRALIRAMPLPKSAA